MNCLGSSGIVDYHTVMSRLLCMRREFPCMPIDTVRQAFKGSLDDITMSKFIMILSKS